MQNCRPLDEQDEKLIKEAEEVIEKCYVYERHHIGSALRTKAGTVYSAVHLEANVGRIAVCAEAIAMGKAISEMRLIRSLLSLTHIHMTRVTNAGSSLLAECVESSLVIMEKTSM